MGELDGKVAVVTGAAHGLGRIHALNLASMGARVVVNDLGAKADGTGRDEEPAWAVVEEIEKEGGRAIAVGCDARDEEQVVALVDRMVEDHALKVVNSARISYQSQKKAFDEVVEQYATDPTISTAETPLGIVALPSSTGARGFETSMTRSDESLLVSSSAR